jgi:hypothetical protein
VLFLIKTWHKRYLFVKDELINTYRLLSLDYQSPTHEGHESLPEEQHSTQQKVVLFQTLSYLVSSHNKVSVLNILQSTSTPSLPNLPA